MTQPILQVDGLCRRFGGLQALKDVSFAAPTGIALGIIGPNGSGKSTLFENIAGGQQPNAGRIQFKGRDVTRLRAHERCALGIGRTFQMVETFGLMSVFENILVAAMLRHGDAAAKQRTASLLDKLDLREHRERPARELTGSELRRLDVARALATDPSLLLLDEPLAGLTSVEIERTFAHLRELREDGLTIIMIEHRLEAMFGFVSHVMALNAGEIIAQGTAEEVRSNERVIAAYLGTGKPSDA